MLYRHTRSLCIYKVWVHLENLCLVRMTVLSNLKQQTCLGSDVLWFIRKIVVYKLQGGQEGRGGESPPPSK